MPNKSITKKNPESERGKVRERIVFISTLLFCLIFIVALMVKVPPSMDEFLPYHQIACIYYPNAAENIFRESCSVYNLNIFGASLPLRAYSYTGFTPSLIYLPFFLLWKSYLSARLLKLLAFLLLAFLVKKISRLNGWMTCSIVLLCLPLAFQYIVDLGPFAFQGTIALAAAYLIARSKSYWGGALAGALLFIGVDQKPIFSVLLLPIALLAVALIYENKKVFIREKVKRVGVIFAAVFSMLLPLSLLFLSKNNSGISYFKELASHPAIGIFNFSRQYEQFGAISPFLGSFEKFGHLVFDTHNISPWPTAVVWIIYALLILFAIHKKFTDKDPSVQNSFWPFLASLFGFLFAIWGVSRMQESGNAHHPIIAFPFLILSIAYALGFLVKRKYSLAAIVAIVLAALNIFMGYDLLSSPIQSQHDWSRLKIMNEFNNPKSSKRYLYVAADWGMYYLMSLYGQKNQTVVFVEPINSKEQVEAIDKIAKRKNLTPVYITREAYGGSVEFVKKYHTLRKMSYSGGNDSSVWQVYATIN